MTTAGRLELRVVLDATQAVVAVDVHSTRPAVSVLLSGRPPHAALELVGLLFQLCRHAQGAAAEAALAAASGLPAPAERAASEGRVAAEVLQEHLWRLLLDWPTLLGLDPDHARFRAWHARLRQDQPVRARLHPLLAEFERGWLGGPALEWLALPDLAALQDWSSRQHSPAARLCHRLADLDDCSRPGPLTPLLADQDARAVQLQWAGAIDESFTRLPQLDGAPRETGVLAWQAQAPLLRDVLLRRPGRVLARWLARVRDTLQILLGTAAPRVDAAAAGPAGGLALVRTARGLLLHQVRLALGRVESWRVVAPTEWNFHPDGALVRGLLGSRIADPTLRQLWVQAQLLSLDPCVAATVEFQHA